MEQVSMVHRFWRREKEWVQSNFGVCSDLLLILHQSPNLYIAQHLISSAPRTQIRLSRSLLN